MQVVQQQPQPQQIHVVQTAQPAQQAHPASAAPTPAALPQNKTQPFAPKNIQKDPKPAQPQQFHLHTMPQHDKPKPLGMHKVDNQNADPKQAASNDLLKHFLQMNKLDATSRDQLEPQQESSFHKGRGDFAAVNGAHKVLATQPAIGGKGVGKGGGKKGAKPPQQVQPPQQPLHAHAVEFNGSQVDMLMEHNAADDDTSLYEVTETVPPIQDEDHDAVLSQMLTNFRANPGIAAWSTDENKLEM